MQIIEVTVFQASSSKDNDPIADSSDGVKWTGFWLATCGGSLNQLHGFCDPYKRELKLALLFIGKGLVNVHN